METAIKSPLSQIHALYVEDEDIIRDHLSEYIKRRVKKLDSACHGEEGLQKFQELQPDVVITDIRMPKMNGLEMARRIKELSPQTPILILSAHNEVDDLVTAIDIGVDKFLFKPIKTPQFNQTLEQIAENVMNKRLAIEKSQMLEEYRHLIDVSAVVVKIDLEGNMVYVNDEFCTLSGYGREELMGRQFCELWHENDKKSIRQDIDQNLLHRLIWKGNLHCLTKDKNDFYVDMVVVPILDADGNHAESIIMQYDITELVYKRKQLEVERDKLEKMAMTDNLTGIYNRNKFYQLSEYEVTKTRRYGHDLSVIMFDIDNFKQVNDTHGHDVGDAVLKQIASIVIDLLRQTDVFARWGGEEFVIMCPETSLDNTTKLAERLRESMAKGHFESVGHLTCSFGVSRFSGESNIDELLKKADDNLYSAKKSGKNCVISD